MFFVEDVALLPLFGVAGLVILGRLASETEHPPFVFLHNFKTKRYAASKSLEKCPQVLRGQKECNRYRYHGSHVLLRPGKGGVSFLFDQPLHSVAVFSFGTACAFYGITHKCKTTLVLMGQSAAGAHDGFPFILWAMAPRV